MLYYLIVYDIIRLCIAGADAVLGAPIPGERQEQPQDRRRSGRQDAAEGRTLRCYIMLSRRFDMFALYWYTYIYIYIYM